MSASFGLARRRMQHVAKMFPVRLAAEGMHPRFYRKVGPWGACLTAVTGYAGLKVTPHKSFWHASITHEERGKGGADAHHRIAMQVLKGLGSQEGALQVVCDHLDEAGTYHVLRFMTVAEQKMLGDPLDVRGTEEEEIRLRAVSRATGTSVEQLKLIDANASGDELWH